MKNKFLIPIAGFFALTLVTTAFVKSADSEDTMSFFVESDNIAFAETGGGGGGYSCKPKNRKVCQFGSLGTLIDYVKVN